MPVGTVTIQVSPLCLSISITPTDPRSVYLERTRGSWFLLVHGNNHIHCELADKEPEIKSLAQMHQALNRIERLERRSEVRVARVIAPPHGVFGTKMMCACAKAGFEAACVSWGSIWNSNRHLEWTRTPSSSLLKAGPSGGRSEENSRS